jgi:hypothetical protein
MAYVGVSNVAVANGAGTYLWVLKESLAGQGGAGWTVVSSSSPNAPGGWASGDNLPTVASFAVAGAWARVREPGGVGGREYILQNGTANGVNAIIKYSRADGFTGGSPSATVAPTTGGGDGVVMVGTGTDASPVSNVLANATGYVSAVASDTASPGVYGCFAWYLVGYLAGGTGVRLALTEAVTPGSTSSLDQDPTWRFGTSSGAVAGTAANQLGPWQLGGAWYTNEVLGISYWQAYGLAGEVYNTGGQTGFVSSRTPAQNTWTYNVNNFVSVSPYDGKEPMYPMLVGQAGVSSVGIPARIPKGYSTGVATFSVTHNLLDTFNLNTADPKIAVHLTASGLVSIAVPWLTNVVPAI